MWYHEIDLGCLFAPVCGDSRGDCYIWSSENGDFSIVGVRMEEKTLSQGSRHLSLQIFQIRLLVNFFCYIYLKILCIYFVMHYKNFDWILYDYAYFTIHIETADREYFGGWGTEKLPPLISRPVNIPWRKLSQITSK
jgi:hypothetical protein